MGDRVNETQVFFIKKTDEKGNIDLRVKYNPANIDEKYDPIDDIQSATRLEYLLRDYSQSFEPASVRAEESADGIVTISFKYSKYGLPQDIAYFRFMSASIELKDGEPMRMTISNTKPFLKDKYFVDSYQQTILFTRLENGRITFSSKETELIATTHKNEPVKITNTVIPVAFYEDTRQQVLDEDKLLMASDPRNREEKVNINRVLPLMGDLVRRQGIDLPLPYGISFVYRKQEMDIPFTDLGLMGLDLNEIFSADKSFGTVSADSIALRGDVFILPFWNVYALLGKVYIDAKIDANYTGKLGDSIKDSLNNKLDGLGDYFCENDTVGALCGEANFDIAFPLEYDLAGVGTTLAVGYREFIATLTAGYSATRLKGSDEWGDGIITVQPMIGYQLVDYRMQLFVGAEYQAIDPYFRGELDFEIAGEPFSYDIGHNLNKWAYMVGFNKEIGRNYAITFLYNKGETRSSTTINLAYRF